MWPKTTLLLSVWPRDAKRLDPTTLANASRKIRDKPRPMASQPVAASACTGLRQASHQGHMRSQAHLPTILSANG